MLHLSRIAPAFSLALTVSTAVAADDEITIVLTGDTGFSRNNSPVHPKGVLKFGKRPPFRAAIAGIANEVDGDLNFTNIETVVIDRNDLRRDTKGQRGPPDQPVILFDYDPSRSGAVPFRLLADFKGTLQTDGYEGYAATATRDDIVHVGCLAHARRKFDEAVKAQAKTGRGGLAKQGLELIQKIYRVEREARDRELDCHTRKQLRDEKARPLWDELRRWLDRSIGQVPPQPLTGKALGYLDKQWPRLIRYLDDGRVEVDNNLTENAIRPFVMGRKAWLFSDTPAGADASARLYNLIETAKANGLEPYAYLRNVFTEMPKATTANDVEALLPWNVDVPRSLGDAQRCCATTRLSSQQ
jgi:transposase